MAILCRAKVTLFTMLCFISAALLQDLIHTSKWYVFGFAIILNFCLSDPHNKIHCQV